MNAAIPCPVCDHSPAILKDLLDFSLISGNPGLELVAGMVESEVSEGYRIEEAPSIGYLAELFDGEPLRHDMAEYGWHEAAAAVR